MTRVDLIRDAQRPKLAARALFQGPQGSGKTWTMLSVATQMAVHDDGSKARILAIDTERESMLTYADVFAFKHLPWQAPYDPAELTTTLDVLATHGAPNIGVDPLGTDDVLIIDSLSHFWQGTGGILDIANGRVQGGWDKARPLQNALVEQLLAMPCHVLLGARMKNTVLISDGGKTIENVGLTIVQDDTLAYELNVVLQLDAHHNASVIKSRTTAVPVGRMYPGGHELKFAADYTEWLAGGIPPANREDVERVVAVFAGITDKEARAKLKEAFVAAFGMPHALTAERIPAVYTWLAENGAPVGEGPAADGGAEAAQEPPAAPEDDGTPECAAEPVVVISEPQGAEQALPSGGPAEEPQPHDVPHDPASDKVEQVIDYVGNLGREALAAQLVAAGLDKTGNVPALRQRLGAHLLADPDWQPPQPSLIEA